MEDFSVNRWTEYQAVVIVDCDDGRLFPLTEECPKCLLPIANRKLLSYQLDLLNKSGITEIYVVAPSEYRTQLLQFLSEHSVSDKTRVDFVFVEDMIGSADALRAVNERIRGDFVCLISDLICPYPLTELTSLHRVRAADITMLLASAPYDEAEKKGAPKKMRIDEEDQEYIGMCDDGRVVVKIPALEVEEGISIPKPLLHRCSSSLTMRNDLADMGAYVMSRWILDFVLTHKRISSIRTELIPFVVKRQFQSTEYLYDTIPALMQAKASVLAVDTWLKNADKSNSQSQAQSQSSPLSITSRGSGSELADQIYRELSAAPGGGNGPKKLGSVGNFFSPTKATRQESATFSRQDSVFSANSSSGALAAAKDSGDDDLLRCYGLVYERKGNVGAHGVQQEQELREMDQLHLVQRVTTLQSYLNLNRDVPLHTHSATTTPWQPIAGFQKKELSVIGDACEMGDKVTVKQCAVGKGCTIGAKSKLNNCVIMDNVTIGESCTIQNTVVCSGVTIESNCNLNECSIGVGSKIVTGSKIKGESISATS